MTKKYTQHVINLFGDMNAAKDYHPAHSLLYYNGLGYYWKHPEDEKAKENPHCVVCTQDEFIKEARRLGYIEDEPVEFTEIRQEARFNQDRFFLAFHCMSYPDVTPFYGWFISYGYIKSPYTEIVNWIKKENGEEINGVKIEDLNIEIKAFNKV